MIRRGPIEVRFWSRVHRLGDDECWLWQGYLDFAGYGQIKTSGKTRFATHVSLEISGRPRVGSLNALHSCDTPACVNPSHLRWGTHAENSADKVVRGRSARGHQNGASKLTPDQVVEIRASKDTQSNIASKYAVAPSLVSCIRRNIIWKYI